MATTVMQDMIRDARRKRGLPAFGAEPTYGWSIPEGELNAMLAGGTIAAAGAGYLVYKKWAGTGLVLYALLGAAPIFSLGMFFVGMAMRPSSSGGALQGGTLQSGSGPHTMRATAFYQDAPQTVADRGAPAVSLPANTLLMLRGGVTTAAGQFVKVSVPSGRGDLMNGYVAAEDVSG